MNADEWAKIRALYENGESIKGIAARLGMSRNTVRRALSLQAAPADHKATKGSAFGTHRDEIASILAAIPNASIQEISQRLGWALSRTTLTNYISRVRTELSNSSAAAAARPASQYSVPPIPLTTTAFIGRHQELARLRQLLGEHRLITITGMGGVGKTRLAAHAGNDFRRAFRDGVRLVELASVRSTSLLAQAIFDAVGIGGRDRPGKSTEAALFEFLQERQMLLIIDNCEHLAAECAGLIHRLLRSTRDVKIMATSRETLAVPDEFVFRLAPLSIGSVKDGAIALFADRANSVLSGFTITDENLPQVQRVCERLDGVPLAIELACARLPVLSLTDLADRLDHRLDLLTTGNRAASERHRSLVATIDWSFDHCTRDEQLMWSRASVFAGGFDLDLAERVCADADLAAGQLLDSISGLVSKSIVLRQESSGVVRFLMLESIREYGQDRLSESESGVLRARQTQWCQEMLADSVDRWFSNDQAVVSRRLRENRANVRQILDAVLASTNRDGMAQAVDLVSEPWFMWATGFSLRECQMWLIHATELATDVPEQQAKALTTLALLQSLQGDRDSATESLDRATSLAAQGNDVATSDFIIHTTGLNEYFAGNFERSEALLASALDRYSEREPRAGLMSALLVHLGMHYVIVHDPEQAERYFQRAIDRSVEVSERWFRAYATWGLGVVALLQERYEQAMAHAKDSVELIRGFDDVIGTTLVTDLVAWSEAAAGSPERAATLLGAASEMWGSFGQQLYGSTQWVTERERYESRARKALGNSAYARLHRTGESMSERELVAYMAGEQDPARSDAPDSFSHEALTPREREVAAYVAHGLSNKEIASQMVLSPRTIEGHVEHILQKLCITNRNQVASVFPVDAK